MTFDLNWHIHEKVRWLMAILVNETKILNRKKERKRDLLVSKREKTLKWFKKPI